LSEILGLFTDKTLSNDSGKTKTKMEGLRPEGHNRYPGDTRLEKANRSQRRIEASLEGDQGPEMGCIATDRWKKGQCPKYEYSAICYVANPLMYSSRSYLFKGIWKI
jgi:hypothetical protein